MTSTTATDSPMFATLGIVVENDNSIVEVPAERAKDFANAATYFSGRTNRVTLTVATATEADAKLLARQIKQYAADHHLSTAPKRDGSSVTFRFSRTRKS